jgi:nucleotide-binding universal stress UspA family protein
MDEAAPIVCGIRDWADVAAAEVAARVASALGLRLVLVHVLPAQGAPEPGGGVLERPWDDDSAHRLLEAVAGAVGAEAATRVSYGPPGQALAREAAALLVIGRPSRGLVGSMLTGSATTHLLRRSRRPLLVCSALQAPLWPDQRSA